MRDGAVGVGIYNAQVAGVSDFRIDAERIGGEQQPAGRRNLAVRRGGVSWRLVGRRGVRVHRHHALARPVHAGQGQLRSGDRVCAVTM